MKLLSILLTLSISSSALAGDYGASSLIPAFVNVILLSCGLIYLLKSKASNFFTDKSSAVAQMIDRAASKAREAEEMMAVQKKKISGADDEISGLKTEQEKLLAEYEASYVSEVKERITKLDEDAKHKIEAEKTEMLGELNANLLDLVIADAKSKIKADPALAKNAANNMIKGL